MYNKVVNLKSLMVNSIRESHIADAERKMMMRKEYTGIGVGLEEAEAFRC